MTNKQKESKRKPTITFYADPIMVEYVFAEVKKKDMNVSQFLRQLIRDYHAAQNSATNETIGIDEISNA